MGSRIRTALTWCAARGGGYVIIARSRGAAPMLSSQGCFGKICARTNICEHKGGQLPGALHNMPAIA